MPTISYDGQSLSIEGRRVWLVSGTIHYTRVPHELWRDRLRAARQAGLNCIETYVFWNVHESAPGKFNFEGDQDLRRFIQMIGEEGMFCILRPGPYIGAEWDFGGLPAWLSRIEAMRLREANGPFLEACARYLGAVMEQVRDLQVSASAPRTIAAQMPGGGGGPILLIQAENGWMCDNRVQADKYLAEIVRYLRENGASCPIFECNNLWTQVEGAFSTWKANQRLPASLRQLRHLQPDAPRLVSEYGTGSLDHWGGGHHQEIDASLHEYRMAGILGVGAQFNLYRFHGGTNFGFFGGRSLDGLGGYVTTSDDCNAPLLEAGGRSEKYYATKRMCTFASQFGHVLAHLDGDDHAATVAPDESMHSLAVMHQRGVQGEVIFLIKSAADRTEHVDVLLSTGQTLPVPLGTDRVAWVVVNVRLGAAELSYTNLRPWAFVDRRMLVLFGPAGARGLVGINGAPMTVDVPTGETPVVGQHENLTVVVLNREQVDAAYITHDRLIVGAASLDGDEEPVSLRGWAAMTTVTSNGEVATTVGKRPMRITSPRLGKWQCAVPHDMISGESSRYAQIEGPASLEALKCDYGYGWYRISAKATKARSVLAPNAADRLHVYNDGKLAAILGYGPEAELGPVNLKLNGSTVVLADNLGRFDGGWRFGEQKGLPEHFYAVREARLGKAEIEQAQAPDLFALRGYFQQARAHERPTGTRLTWTLKPSGRNPLIVDITAPWRAMVLVNDEPVGAYDPVQSAGFVRLVLHVGAQLKPADNRITLAMFQVIDARKLEMSKIVRVYQALTAITARASWAFAPWTLPENGDFSGLGAASGGKPAWYRCQFSVSRRDVPLWLEPRGMSKGHIYLNGRNVGRFFIATRSGASVGPQSRYYLPEPWLNMDGPNELLLFDEHANPPTQCKLVYEPLGPYGK